ncbi:MAG: BatD family protein [Candidatus Zixiibacteriota bacterium]
MGKAITQLLIILCLLSTAVSFADDDIELKISLDRDKIGLEEVATLSVELTSRNQRELPKPNLPPLTRFDIYSLGTSMQIVQDNSGMKVVYSYNYALSPKKTGTFPINAAWIVVNGKRYESNTLQIEIVGSAREASGPLGDLSMDDRGKQKDMFIVTETDKKEAFVDEQVTLTLKFFRMSRVELMSNPTLSQLTAPDFWVNDISDGKPYRQILNGNEYIVTEKQWALYPTKPGKLKVDALRITATVPDKQSRRSRDPFSIIDNMFAPGKNVTVKSQPLTVSVNPLPEAGKPRDFSGAVGQYNIFAIVDRQDVEVNESITLKVEITGRGNVKSIPEPKLPELDGIRFEKSSSDFRQSLSGGTIGGTKTFEYLLLPRVPGRLTIEPLTLTYFDPSKNKYQTSKTKPITLNVRQGELAAGSEIPFNQISGQTINLQETDIRHIKTTGTHLVSMGSLTITSPVFLSFVGIPMLALIGGIVDVRRKRKLSGDVAYARLRRAKGVAQKRLKNAATLMNSNDDGFYAELSGVIYQFVADKLNQSAQGLTSESVLDLLTARNASDTLKVEIKEVLQDADFGRFAGTGSANGNKQDLYKRAEAIISELEETL